MITSLIHPHVGDLEISLVHSGMEALLLDRPPHDGENLDSTGFDDHAMYYLRTGYEPYKGWWIPEDHLGYFNTVNPDGDWTLTIFDHGSGGTKAPSTLEGWRLDFLVKSTGGETDIPAEKALANFGLEQIRPNPLNREAMITFRIQAPGPATLRVYNQLGQLVGTIADETLPEGVHERVWQPGSLAPGTYFIQLRSGAMISVRKAVVSQ
jgi:subtilisin-like proprotein convertase family protein